MIKQIKNTYCCIGLMSGTSLDGLDMVLCDLHFDESSGWSFDVKEATTVAYSSEWEKKLRGAVDMSGLDLMFLHREYGAWLAIQVNTFKRDKSVDFIASHGHTIFHQPGKAFNFQLGDGQIIAAQTGLITIADFRSLDVCLGGQGAPLVPIGDQLLFSEYDACVNIGGFANVSCQRGENRIAWDLCPVNFVLNRLVSEVNLTYDKDGHLGQQGKAIPELVSALDQLDYYQKQSPKSLGQEWVDENFWPILLRFRDEPLVDRLASCYQHMAGIIATELNTNHCKKVLFTGGGAYNQFLISSIRSKLKGDLIVPDPTVIDYKEALVFALLGVLRMRNEVNCLASVTGAKCDSSSGVIYHPQ